MKLFEKIQLKGLLTTMKLRRSQMIKNKHGKSIIKAKNALITMTEFIKLEDNGSELTPTQIMNMDNDSVLKLFETVIKLLEELYISDKK